LKITAYDVPSYCKPSALRSFPARPSHEHFCGVLLWLKNWYAISITYNCLGFRNFETQRSVTEESRRIADRASSRTSNRRAKYLDSLPPPNADLPRPPRLHQEHHGMEGLTNHAGTSLGSGSRNKDVALRKKSCCRRSRARTTQPQATMHLETSTNTYVLRRIHGIRIFTPGEARGVSQL